MRNKTRDFVVFGNVSEEILEEDFGYCFDESLLGFKDNKFYQRLDKVRPSNLKQEILRRNGKIRDVSACVIYSRKGKIRVEKENMKGYNYVQIIPLKKLE